MLRARRAGELIGEHAMRAAGAGLFEEKDGRENGHGEHQNQPLEIVAFEPAREMQDQNDNCDYVKCVEHVFFLLIGSSSFQAKIRTD